MVGVPVRRAAVRLVLGAVHERLVGVAPGEAPARAGLDVLDLLGAARIRGVGEHVGGADPGAGPGVGAYAQRRQGLLALPGGIGRQRLRDRGVGDLRLHRDAEAEVARQRATAVDPAAGAGALRPGEGPAGAEGRLQQFQVAAGGAAAHLLQQQHVGPVLGDEAGDLRHLLVGFVAVRAAAVVATLPARLTADVHEMARSSVAAAAGSGSNGMTSAAATAAQRGFARSIMGPQRRDDRFNRAIGRAGATGSWRSPEAPHPTRPRSAC